MTHVSVTLLDVSVFCDNAEGTGSPAAQKSLTTGQFDSCGVNIKVIDLSYSKLF